MREKEQIEAHSPNFGDVRALILGDVMLDRYVIGRTDRVSPEAPVPVVRVEEEWAALGGASNVAVNCAGLGSRVEIFGIVGDDASGRECRSALGDAGIGTAGLIEVPDRPTTVKTRVLAGSHHVTRIDHEDDKDLTEEDGRRLIEALVEALPGADVLVLQDYNKGVLTSSVISSAIAAAEEAGVPVVVDPKRRRFFDYGGSSIFKPNRRELEDAFGTEFDPENRGQLIRMREELGCASLVVTLGARGMVAIDREDRWMSVPAFAQEVFDVSGAGDTVVSVLALATAADSPLSGAIEMASHAAAVAVSHVGARPVSLEELRSHIRGNPDCRVSHLDIADVGRG